MLIFRKQEQIPESDKDIHAAFTDESRSCLRVADSSSLVRYRIIGTSTSGFTWNGKRLALALWQGLEDHDRAGVLRAAEEYEILMRKERIGDEYTALLWFCQMYLKEEQEREKILEDLLIRKYYEFFSDEDYSTLKKYLWNKYNLKEPLSMEKTEGTMETQDPDIPLGQLNEWSEYLTFNNPNRYLWEKTDEMLSYLDMKEGERVADIGCGSGFFSWQFAKRVGKSGCVYATEINPDALSYVETLKEEGNVRIIPTAAALNDVCLDEDCVDIMFLCSMYHAVYIASIEFVKDAFLLSMKRSLRPGGRLYIVDNDITPHGAPAYFGPGIAKELVISQLGQYGFRLEEIKQFVPQRYILKFRNEKPEGMWGEKGGKECI